MIYSRERYIIENRRFYYLVARASGNLELARMLRRLHDRLVHTGDEIEKRHNRLIEALRSCDFAVARETILEEVNETREITLAHVIEKEGATWYLGTQTD